MNLGLYFYLCGAAAAFLGGFALGHMRGQSAVWRKIADDYTIKRTK